MILPDLNLLLYAYNPHASRHTEALQWWGDVLNGAELIGLPHEILFGFVRIATNSRLGPAAVPLEAAWETVNSWTDQPHAKLLVPGPDHFAEVMVLMQKSNSSGKILSDAVLANYAIANRATLYSTDSDFSRFPDLEWVNPI